MGKRMLSLFSGCGGMDLGFEGGFNVLSDLINPYMFQDKVESYNGTWAKLKPTGFETVFANDIMPESQSAWTRFWGKKKGFDVEDIFRLGSIVDFVNLSKEINSVFPSKVDIVVGGFPCNDFSVSGLRQGFDSKKTHRGSIRIDEPSIESRGKLYMWMRAVLEITQPNVFVAENVKGLISLGDAKRIIENDFRGVDGGYLVVPARVLKAVDYGIPQTRERVFFLGFRKDKLRKSALQDLQCGTIPDYLNPYPRPTHSFSPAGDLCPWTTSGQALKGLAEPDESEDLSHRFYSKAKFMGKHCQGQKEINLGLPAPTIRAEHHGNIEYRRLSSEHGGLNIAELAQNLPERRLSVRECARIQTFPDDYDFVIKNHGARRYLVSSSSAYKLIGNAVPPLLAYHLATRLQEIWNDLFY
nr:DNA (cytosine-5-)-methyltransferase [uncultured Dethiosulfovibrio sp.]